MKHFRYHTVCHEMIPLLCVCVCICVRKEGNVESTPLAGWGEGSRRQITKGGLPAAGLPSNHLSSGSCSRAIHVVRELFVLRRIGNIIIGVIASQNPSRIWRGRPRLRADTACTSGPCSNLQHVLNVLVSNPLAEGRDLSSLGNIYKMNS